MSTSQNGQPESRSSKVTLVLRLVLVAALAVSGALLVKFTPLGELMAEERVLALAETLRGNPWTPILLIVGYFLTGPIGLPVSPLVIIGGTVFGPVLGTLYNTIGLVGNGMLTYWIGRMLGREAVVRLAGPKLRRAEALFERRGFWPLVQVRFLPVPAPVVSYGAALAGVSATRFLITTTLGLGTACAVHTYYVPALILAMLAGEEPVALFFQYMALLVFFNVAAAWPQIRQILYRRRRYAELIELRRQRAASSPQRDS